MPLKVFTSNRLENLSDTLAQTLSAPLDSPLAPEVIVVQSSGMQRWISLEIADKLGICANIQFPFPNTFIHKITRLVLPDLPERSIYEPDLLTWRLMKLLPGCLSHPAFLPLQTYLREPGANIKRLQLSARIADLFDQYLLFRPDLILKWEKGKETHWQAELWRRLVSGHKDLHRAALGKKLIKLLRSARTPSLQFPERISVFGISSLPEFHIQVFDAISRFAAVNLFLLNPCREYWGDIRTKKEQQFSMAKSLGDQLAIDFSAPDLYFEEGNSLLASLGKLGRDFFDLLEEKLNFTSEEKFSEPEGSTLLACLQTDILTLKNRGNDHKQRQDQTTTSSGADFITETDRSIQLHSCHSERREVEVLQDHLLAMLAKNPQLEPGDIMVMAPDIEPYVPFIQSVFDLPVEDSRRLTYSIADRSYHRESELVETFFTILNLPNNRFSATEILDILEAPAVYGKYGLEEGDMEIIRIWVEQTRIHWGKDAANRKRLGLPAVAQNTWRSGLERLMLGYALPGNNEQVYAETILPFDNVEGQQAETLGALVEFIERLFALADALEQPRTLVGWSKILNEILNAFFQLDAQNTQQAQVIRQVLDELEVCLKLTGFDETVELNVVKSFLQNKLQGQGYGYGFLAGGITFCSMLPMRSIPAKVICLIGMNTGAYPHSTRPPGFDLIAQKPRRGDRSRRNDDRYLFLEALLSARETFYLSFIGQSIKDNSSIPPSVLISELISYLDKNYLAPGGKSVKDFICVQHRLQAFSPEYFLGKKRLFSYSEENKNAAVALTGARKLPPPFFAGKPLSEPGDEFRAVTIEDLCRFFRNPVQFLCNKRLELRFEENETRPRDQEIFSLQNLDRYQVATQMLAGEKSLANAEQFKTARRLAGELPHGSVGEVVFDELHKQVKEFAGNLYQIVRTEPLSPLEINLELDGFKLTGKLEPIFATGLLLHRYAKIKARDHLRVWICHLALNMSPEQNYPRESFLAGLTDLKSGGWSAWKYKQTPEAGQYLRELLQLYWFGLHQPLRFFPESSYAYFDKLTKSKGKKSDSLATARGKWFGSDFSLAELDDAYFYRCFAREETPLNAEFEKFAQLIWRPIFENRDVM